MSKLENVIDFLFVKLRLPVFRALWGAAFLFGVCHVVEWCTEKKMFWVYTGAIVAAVTNKKAIGYGSIVEFIAKAMGGHSVFDEFSTDQNAIPVRVFSASPEPTGIGFFDMIPKVFFKGKQTLMFVVASFTAIFCAAFTQPKAFSRKFIFALWTNATNAAPTIDDYGWFAAELIATMEGPRAFIGQRMRIGNSYTVPANRFVEIVFAFCSKFKMGWIATSRKIANVSNNKIVRNGAVCQFVGNTVRADNNAIQGKFAVAAFGTTAKPFPAFVRVCDFNLFPKALFKCLKSHTLFAPIKKPLAGGIGAVVSSKRTPRQRAIEAYNICARFPNYALAR